METKTTPNRWALGATMTLTTFLAAGCVAGIPLDANMRIDVSGTSYSQQGMPLDRRQMVDVLGTEPENRERIDSAKGLSTASLLLSAAGGGLIGWPTGQYLAGDRHPPLWMFGVGGAFAVTGVILGAISSSHVSDAVDVHNIRIAKLEELAGQEQQRREAPPPAKALPPLAEGFGFAFDKGSEDAGPLCRAVGYEWSEKDGVFLCSGVPMSEIEKASAELSFALGHVSSLRIVVHPDSNAKSWAKAIDRLETTLVRMYGPSTKRDFTVPSACSGDAFMGCLTSGKVSGQAAWLKTKERSAFMAIVNTAPAPTLVAEVSRVAPAR